jgi:galactoside O-acetyltransferase
MIGRYVTVGAGTVVLPGVTLGIGCAVGALTLVNRDVEPYAVVVGSPFRTIGVRESQRLADLERRVLEGEDMP